MIPIINKIELSGLIPHSGLMCLNDGVVEWDKQSILCITRSHLFTENPLYKNNKLSSVHAIEYCAQAMAVHGGLLAREQGESLAPGYLAAVRNVEFSYQYLDEIHHDLFVSATRLMAQGGSLIYEFNMYYKDADKQYKIASGRATVVQISEAA